MILAGAATVALRGQGKAVMAGSCVVGQGKAVEAG